MTNPSPPQQPGSDQQQIIESRYEQLKNQAHDQDRIIADVFGPIEDWTLKIGQYQLILMPLTGEWLYLHPLYETWERTSYKAGEVRFHLQDNLLEGQALDEKPAPGPAVADLAAARPAIEKPPTKQPVAEQPAAQVPPFQADDDAQNPTQIIPPTDQEAIISTLIAQDPITWQVVILSDSQHRQPYSLGKQTRLGRVSDNEIVLPDPLVSRHHAEIQWRDGAHWLSDLKSQNGTYHNDQRIEQPVRLAPGDQIRIGSTTLEVTIA